MKVFSYLGIAAAAWAGYIIFKDGSVTAGWADIKSRILGVGSAQAGVTIATPNIVVTASTPTPTVVVPNPVQAPITMSTTPNNFSTNSGANLNWNTPLSSAFFGQQF